MSKEKEGALVADAPRDISVIDYGEDVGSGFQNQSRDDVALPFIDILQPGSPEVLTGGRDGARPGEIINRVTGETFDGESGKGIILVPAITEHCYTEWKPRKSDDDPNAKGGAGGGFIGRHELDEDVVKRARAENPFKKFRLPNGNDLVETFYVYGLQVMGDGTSAPIGAAFGSTKIKAYKNWMYIARAIQVLAPGNRRVNPPLFSHKYRMTTKMVEKDGNRWFVPVMSFANGTAEGSRLLPPDALYQEARAVMVAYNAGNLRADYSSTSNEDVATEAGEKPPF